MIFNFSKNIFGLDISEKSLRLVRLNKKGKNFSILSFNEVALGQGVIINGEIKKEELLIKAIHQVIKKTQGNNITTKNIVSVLPEPKTFIKVINITLKENESLIETIKEEIKNQIPLDITEIYLDWQVVEQNDQDYKILIGASTREISDSYFNILKKAGLTPLVLEVEALAIIRALIKEKTEDKKTKIIIDFGAVRTGLIVYDQGTVQFTVSLPISGNKITKTISDTLKLDYKKSEKVKIVCGLDKKKCEGALLKILVANINDLSKHIQKSITYYKTNFTDSNPVGEIILCGGGANFNQIDKVLSEKLKIPVTIGNPLVNLGKIKKINIPQNKLLSYTTAIGLAKRVWRKGNII